MYEKNEIYILLILYTGVKQCVPVNDDLTIEVEN